MQVESKLFLAPMAGYTDLPFRLLARENGADITVSEMVSAKGLHFGDIKTERLLQTEDRESPYGVQIFGSEPEILSDAVEILKKKREDGLHFDYIDFNAGCPAPKIVKNGDGSALLNNPTLFSQCISAIKEAADDLPVSVKTRIGFEDGENNIDQIVQTVEEAGADFITIHPRTRSQFYSGKSDWSAVEKVINKTNLPIVLSGDINSPESAVKALETGVSALMIGRAALENPYIFNQIKQYLSTGRYNPLSIDQKLDIINRHIDLCLEYKASDRIIIEMRKQLANYTKGLPGAAMLRQKIFSLENVEDVRDTFEQYR